MKRTAAPLLLILCLAMSAFAEDKVWKARVTVETVDGMKSQAVCSFLPEHGALLPFKFGKYGATTLRIIPRGQDQTFENQGKLPVFTHVYYTLTRAALLTMRDNTLYPDEIFSAALPVVFGKDQQLLKCSEGTVTVRLSGSEEKE
jgi:hypothetical protein